jgi:hypothetical protein
MDPKPPPDDHNAVYERFFDAMGQSPFISDNDLALVAPRDFDDILDTSKNPFARPPGQRRSPFGRLPRYDTVQRLYSVLLNSTASEPLEQLLRWLRPSLRKGNADHISLKMRSDGGLLLHVNGLPQNFNIMHLMGNNKNNFTHTRFSGRRNSSPFGRNALSFHQIQSIVTRINPPKAPTHVNRRMYLPDEDPKPASPFGRPKNPGRAPFPRRSSALSQLKVSPEHVEFLYLDLGYDGRHMRLYLLGGEGAVPRLHIGPPLQAHEAPYIQFALRLQPEHYLSRQRLSELGLQTAATVRGVAVDVQDTRYGRVYRQHYAFSAYHGIPELLYHRLDNTPTLFPPLTARGFLTVPSLGTADTCTIEITLSFAYPARPRTRVDALYMVNGTPRENNRCKWALMQAFTSMANAGEKTAPYRRDTKGNPIMPEPFCVVDVQLSTVPAFDVSVDTLVAEKVEALAHDAIVNLALEDASLPARLRRYAARTMVW